MTPKTWGFEDEVANLEYCGKRMFVREQYRCSIHKHEKKDETFLVAQGALLVETGDSPTNLTGNWMQDNDRVRIKPGTWHRFTAIRDTLLFEFSTHHEDSDSIRHVASGKVSDDEFRHFLAAFCRFQNMDRVLMTPDEAGVIAADIHAQGRVIGMSNGCFDILHIGHMEFLRQAKFRCEVLFVAVNTDESVRKLKGPTRPFNDEASRIGVISSLRNVDFVVRSSGTDHVDIVRAIKPDVYITGEPLSPEGREAIKLGGKIETIEKIPGYSTTIVSNRMLARQ